VPGCACLERGGANGGLELSADPVVAGVLLRTAALVAGLALVAEQPRGGGSSLALSAAAVSAPTVSTTVPGACSTAMVALVGARSVMVAVQLRLGHPAHPESVSSGARPVGLNGALPLSLSVAAIAWFPVSDRAGFWPGDWLAPDRFVLVAVTSAVAAMFTSTSALPRPASSAVH
jgi:hypothetical protein